MCRNIWEREREGERGGREGMKREITSHPTPSLLNYNNLTHMGWPPWQRERGGEPLCGGGDGGGEGIPALGDHSSYLELRYEKTDLMSGSPRSAAGGLVKVVVRRRPHVQPPTLHLQSLMTSTWNEETRDWWRSLVNVSVSLAYNLCVSVRAHP